MKESRRALVFMPDGDMSVEDLSGQVGEVEGIRWSEDCVAPSGVCRESAHKCRCELGDVHFCRAEGIAKIEARADIDRRHSSVAQPTGGLWWLLERLRGLPPECGPPPVLFRGTGNLCVLKTVGYATRGQMLVEPDRFVTLKMPRVLEGLTTTLAT